MAWHRIFLKQNIQIQATKSEKHNKKETPSSILEMLRTAVCVVSSFFPLNQTLLLNQALGEQETKVMRMQCVNTKVEHVFYN